MPENHEHKILLELLQGTAEVMGGDLKPQAKMLMADDLQSYPLFAVRRALQRCRHTVTGKLSLALVLEHLQKEDTRPSPHEAWAIALKACDEKETVVWCEEIAASWWLVENVLRMGDPAGARVSFIELYRDKVADARRNRSAAKWSVSPGLDPDLRARSIDSAIVKGLIPEKQRLTFLPGEAVMNRPGSPTLVQIPQILPLSPTKPQHITLAQSAPSAEGLSR